MDPTSPTVWDQLPAPLTFVGGVLVLAIILTREVTKLLAQRNDDARAELAKERARREQVEADRDADITALQEDINQLRGEVASLRDQLTESAAAAHQQLMSQAEQFRSREVELVRANGRLLAILARHDLDPEEDPS